MPRNIPRFIVIHGTDVSRTKNAHQFAAVNRYHQEREFPISSLGYYVGYHFLLESGGQLIRARLDSDEGAHTNQVENGVSVNLQSLAICLAGDFDVELPTPEQIAALRPLISQMRKDYAIPAERIRFHRSWATTKTCPGSLLHDDWLATVIEGAALYNKEPEQADKQARILDLSRQLDAAKTWLLQILDWLKGRKT